MNTIKLRAAGREVSGYRHDLQIGPARLRNIVPVETLALAAKFIGGVGFVGLAASFMWSAL